MMDKHEDNKDDRAITIGPRWMWSDRADSRGGYRQFAGRGTGGGGRSCS